MEGIQFIFDSVQLIDWKDHKVNFRCGSSYIDSPDWIKNKKRNNKSKKEIESHPERVSNMKSFINKYKWKEINYPPKTEYWKTLEKTNNSLNDSEWRKRRLSLSCSKKNYLHY